MAEEMGEILALMRGFIATQTNLDTLHRKVDVLANDQRHICEDVKRILNLVERGTGTELSLQRKADNMQAEITTLRQEVDALHEWNKACQKDRQELRKVAQHRQWQLYTTIVSGLLSLVAVGLAAWMKM